jgi:hypothetical protein
VFDQVTMRLWSSCRTITADGRHDPIRVEGRRGSRFTHTQIRARRPLKKMALSDVAGLGPAYLRRQMVRSCSLTSTLLSEASCASRLCLTPSFAMGCEVVWRKGRMIDVKFLTGIAKTEQLRSAVRTLFKRKSRRRVEIGDGSIENARNTLLRPRDNHDEPRRLRLGYWIAIRAINLRIESELRRTGWPYFGTLKTAALSIGFTLQA